MKNFICLIGFIFFIFSCTNDKNDSKGYSFFVAGHTYGKAGIDNEGFHPPFKDQFEFIRNYKGMSFGVLTGDIVFKSSPKDWKEIDEDISELGVEIHTALGNHEYMNPEMVAKRFEKTYYSFKTQNDLHIVLDPNLDNWNISGEQLQFLRNELTDNVKSVNHIFIYFHQVLWWGPDNGYAHLRLNSKEGRDSNLNFWKEIVPLLVSTQKPVFLFAGDVGGATWAEDCLYNKYENLHLIASGMGDGYGDNFLLVEVDKEVKINLIAIGESNPSVLGTLESYCHIPMPDSLKKEPSKKEILSIKVSVEDIKYKNLGFKTTKSKMESIMGRPDSIVKPNYECGPFSYEWENLKFYQHFYGTMNFIVYADKAEVQNIVFSKDDILQINGARLDATMSFEQVAKELKLKIKPSHSQSSIELTPEENLDEYYILNFKKGKLHNFDRFEPC